MTVLINIIANNMRMIRDNMHLSQKEVAEHIGIPERKYNSIERGRIEPSLATLEKITNYFGISMAELFQNNIIADKDKHLETPTFNAIKFKTKDFKFNREEANAR